ncbi:metallophosphoesterase [Flavobacterium sp. DG1-102-2]|uniref:metallophosphoesterase n=1 Tax=Flavobacterium sp. DG1-102-2 TaxID=3081663 RepID=UPI002948FF8B|nr:metallophosphoesterase [Flavobacterium sp. DG1-102-2]MDV6170314.1 metallophosphoesterase [Flavobacterium sp. DG1-102-2]
MFRWILFFVFVALVEIYVFQTVKTVTKVKWIQYAHIAVSLLILIYIIYQFTQFDRSIGQNKKTLFTMGLLLITYIPKIVITVVMLGEDIIRLIGGAIRAFLGNSEQSFLPDRRKFVSQLALGLAAIPFLSLLYGMTKGKYNFKVIKQTIFFPDLPDAFDGMTITQISDVHSGSFDNHEKIEYAIDLINEQKSDIVLFTGDIVNTHATEMHPWIETFKRIETPAFGKYSVLGNHDYGEYVTWPSQQAKNDNFEAIKDLHRQIDFKLLLNENIRLEKDGQHIALIGLENWGHNFKKAGDLVKASQGVADDDFKILMSHDPSHWEYEVKNNPHNYHLTLAGHTHGLQFGIEIPGIIKWSPVQYVYKQWAGLYENLGRYVYVNRGFGFHAYPGRVGIWPEITVLELKKK